MKRKLWVALLSLVCVVACAFIFVACDGSDDGPNDKRPVLVSINEDDFELCVGESIKLTATILRDDVADKKISWTSTYSDIAVIDEDGYLTAISDGNGVVSARIDGVENETVFCHFHVNVRSESDGIVFAYDRDRGYYDVYSVDKALDTPVVIPSEYYGIPVSRILRSAFIGCSLIPSITVQSSISQIYSKMFSDCTSLTTVILPDGVMQIENEAFAGCTALTDITIPDSVTEIGNAVFQGCTALKTLQIPDSVTYIGYEWFDGCTALESITIPDSVTSIGSFAFQNCTSLTSIIIPATVAHISEGAFNGCTSLTSITLPSTWEYESEYSYQSDYKFGRLFGGNDSVPSGLKTVVINGGTAIGVGAFRGCASITSISIPDSVTTIGFYVFDDCNSLTSITVSADNTVYSSEGGILYNKEKNNRNSDSGRYSGRYRHSGRCYQNR